MVSRWAEPATRWLATLVAALASFIATVITPFGCAVGEYEEDRSCDVSPLGIAAAVVLIAAVVAGHITKRPRLHWAGIATAILLSLGEVF